jgi:hypothetical protein
MPQGNIHQADDFNAKRLSEIFKDGVQGDPLNEQSVKSVDNSILYIGTKVVKGEPMSEYEFLKTFKNKTKEDLNGQETQGDGYKVTYEDGYISWSPKRVFEQCYRLLSSKEIQMAQSI